jgi:hypothetical protein
MIEGAGVMSADATVAQSIVLNIAFVIFLLAFWGARGISRNPQFMNKYKYMWNSEAAQEKEKAYRYLTVNVARLAVVSALCPANLALISLVSGRTMSKDLLANVFFGNVVAHISIYSLFVMLGFLLPLIYDIMAWPADLSPPVAPSANLPTPPQPPQPPVPTATQTQPPPAAAA